MILKDEIKVRYADSFLTRLAGLMGKGDIDFALVLKNLKGSSIHTHFMRFDIDVYFLDENKIVFEKITLKPWKFHNPKRKAEYILETKKGELEIEIGDRIEFD